MGRLWELMSKLPDELLEEGTTGRDLIDAIIDEAQKEGLEEGIRKYAWWKDGTQYVGTCGTTLAEALKSEGIE